MSNSTNSKHAELLNIQSNINATPNKDSSELRERDKIEGTPFWVIGSQEEGYIGIMGKYQITPTQFTKEHVIEYITEHKWEITLTIAGIVAADMMNGLKEQWANERK